MAVWSRIDIAKILADFNLAVQYGIAMHINAQKKFYLAAIKWDRQITKFNSPPYFLAVG